MKMQNLSSGITCHAPVSTIDAYFQSICIFQRVAKLSETAKNMRDETAMAICKLNTCIQALFIELLTTREYAGLSNLVDTEEVSKVVHQQVANAELATFAEQRKPEGKEALN